MKLPLLLYFAPLSCIGPAGHVPAAEPFTVSSTVSISGTLHRVSAIRNSCGEVYGLTYRIGRDVPGQPAMQCIL